MRCMRPFPCHQPEILWCNQMMRFSIFKSNPLYPYIYGAHLLLLMVVYNSV